MMRRLLLIVCCVWAISLQAQERNYSFTDFAAEYLDDENAEYYDELEDLALHPFNINTATRETLLQLPFISEQQADSILSYRTRHRFISSIGELQFIPQLSYSERRFLSVFITCDKPDATPTTFADRWLHGQHSLSAHADIPLYRREGFKNDAYKGAPIAHQLRYRYDNHSRYEYGLTLKNDSGEPFAKHGNHPYDALMFYLHYRSRTGQTEMVAGDYRLSIGRGLLFGSGLYLSKRSLLDAQGSAASILKKHSSSDQVNFFRGIALQHRLGDWRLAAFASARRLDARFDADTARTILTTGYHRTDTELERRRNLWAFVGGAQVAYIHHIGELSATAYYARYNHPVSPSPTYYNAHYLRGRDAAGLSLAYNLQFSNFNISGEAAADKDLHLAFMQSAAWSPMNNLTITLQHRHLQAAFVAPYAKSILSNSRAQNEHGALIGAKFSWRRKWEISAYADFAHFPDATYYASVASNAWEFFGQIKYFLSSQNNILLNYRGKSRQQDITGHRGLTEYVQTHRLRLQLNYYLPRFDFHPSLDATMTGSQTTENKLGWMASLRTTYKPTETLKIGLFGGIFMTDNYATRLYAYEPSLRFGSSNQSFFYHGMRFALTGQCNINRHLSIGAKISYLRYFNRRSISTGNQAIHSRNKSDISLEATYVF